ncbi:MATE family efflux transporter [Pseudomaricurvus sp.]|uniref:MATE family efflux transporter n=1 Tax=Pseudomaricurvus sp. TaxID=2004510 RepID=UPI003F6B119A
MKPSFFAEFKHLWRLASPLLAAQLLSTGLGAVDTLMAGRYGANDLAAVAIGSGLWLPVFLLISGLLIATTSMVARFYGAGDHESIVTTVQQSIWLSLAVAAPCIVLLCNIDFVLGWLAVDPAFAGITKEYLIAVAFGLPGAAIFSSLRSFTEGMGRTKPFMISSFVAFLVNIPLNYGLIYGRWGLPELGGAGCGWATTVSMWSQVLVLYWFISRADRYEGIKLFARGQWPNWVKIRQVARLGFPIALAVFAEVSIFSAIALLLAPLGAVVVASHQIALSVSHLIFMLPLSLSQAITIRVGYFLGRNQQDLANFVVRTGVLSSGMLALTTMTLILTGRHTIVSWYTTDIELQAAAAGLFVWMAIYQFPDQIQIAANASLRAYQDTRKPLAMILLSYWGVAIPLGISLARTDWWGSPLLAEGFWIALVVGLSLTAVLLSGRLIRIARRPVA